VRPVGVCPFLLVAFRVAGKRHPGQFTPFDLGVLLVISDVLQNTVIGSDNSLGGGLVGASVVVALNWKEGITTLSEVRYPISEEDGHASVIPWRPVPA
jgi:uncharacterized membrane protein YcaP (DUF421 family)